MKVIAASTFKANCLSIMDSVQANCEPVIITKRGKSVARLVSIEEKKDDFFGFYADKMKTIGDIESPIIPAGDWKHLKQLPSLGSQAICVLCQKPPRRRL